MQLDIEIDEERLEKSLHSAYRKVASRARIPGFRPGKAPRQVVERLYGRQGLIREALDDLVPDAYNDAIKEHDVDAIDQPDLEIVEMDPVRFKAIVPVRPTVELGDYLSIRADAPEVKVNPEELEEQILLLRRRHATLVPVERPAQWNDQVIAAVRGVVKDEENGEEIPYAEDDDATFILREGQTVLMEGFAEAVVGLAAGEAHTFDITLPDDFAVERFRGTPVHFTVTINELKEEQLPELDDEFANTVNPQWESIDQLRENIESQLLARDQAEADNTYRNTAIDLLIAGATLDYPKIMVDREIDTVIREATGNDAATYRTYLQRVGRSEEEFRESFREVAETRVRRSLVLSQFADAEQIAVTPEEVAQELAGVIESMPDQEDQQLRQLFESEVGRDSVRQTLLSRKTVERLLAIARGEAGAAGEAPAATTDTESTAEEPAAAAEESKEEEPA